MRTACFSDSEISRKPPRQGPPLDRGPPPDRYPLPLWTGRLTHACENITLPQVSFASGKYQYEYRKRSKFRTREQGLSSSPSH